MCVQQRNWKRLLAYSTIGHVGLFLIALGCLFPVYVNTYAAIRGVDAKLVEAGQTFGLNRWGLIRQVILPGALPGFLVGLRFALVTSWLVDVVAEEINAQSGLGYLINQAQTTNRRLREVIGRLDAEAASLEVVASSIKSLGARLMVSPGRSKGEMTTFTAPALVNTKLH